MLLVVAVSFFFVNSTAIFTVPEVQGSTQEVAIAKCRRAAELLGRPCITEDTALCFQALNGLPGPYIKYFLKELGHDGMSYVSCFVPSLELFRSRSPGLNKLLVGFDTTAAWALCTFAYSAGPGHEPILFEGRTDGNIVPARGPSSFGWDPCFEPDGAGQTCVSMFHASDQHRTSHLFAGMRRCTARRRTRFRIADGP